MHKKILIFVVLVCLGGCGPSQKAPATAQKNVHHVFGQDLQKESKIEAKKSQDSKTTTASEQKTTVVAATKTAADSQTSPLRVIEQYTSELQALDEENKDTENRDDLISTKVRKFFDFDTLAKESLGSHWYQINRDDRREYSDLFISLIERSYLSQSKTLVGKYDLQFKDEKINNNKSSVACVVKKDDIDIDIVYHLLKKHNDWMIYNIVFDDVDLIKNYQAQFGRIIEKKKFAGLLSTMRKKLNANDEAVKL